jgi:glycosyltransferase involved in cell wall biosynthesis
MIVNARAMSRIVEDERVDLIHARSRAPAWSALAAAQRARVPFVTTYHGAYGETNPLKRFYNSVMARGDLVIANSTFTADLIVKRYGTSLRRIEVVHRGVDPGVFDPKRVSFDRIESIRQRWGVARNERVVLHPARLTRWKGQNTLIEAARELLLGRELTSTVFILAGDPQGRDRYVKSLHRQIAALSLGDRVRLVGHVDDMPAAYLAAWTTVIASIEPEAFGRTAVEAAAMGCPVIATNIGAPPETILAEPSVADDAMTGWLVPPDDARALAHCLTEALALAPAARVTIGNRAQRHARTQFTVEQMQSRTLAVYDRLLGSNLAAEFRCRHPAPDRAS